MRDREGGREERDRQKDRQSDRNTDRQAGRLTDLNGIGRHTDTQAYKEAERCQLFHAAFFGSFTAFQIPPCLCPFLETFALHSWDVRRSCWPSAFLFPDHAQVGERTADISVVSLWHY